MKRGKFLTILVLSLLLTVINFYIYDAQGLFSAGTFPLQILSRGVMRLAVGPLSCFPVEYSVVCQSGVAYYFLFLINAVGAFLFWFLILSVGLFLIKVFRNRVARN